MKKINILSKLKNEFGSKKPNEINWNKIILKIPLQAHQIEAKEKIRIQRQTWGEFCNGVFLDMPMGFGKTINGLDLIIEFLNKYGNDNTMSKKGILILCSSGDLRNQWCEEIKSKVIFFKNFYLIFFLRLIFQLKVMFFYGQKQKNFQMFLKTMFHILF